MKGSSQPGLPSIWSRRESQSPLCVLVTNQSCCQPAWPRVSRSCGGLPQSQVSSSPQIPKSSSVRVSRLDISSVALGVWNQSRKQALVPSSSYGFPSLGRKCPLSHSLPTLTRPWAPQCRSAVNAFNCTLSQLTIVCTCHDYGVGRTCSFTWRDFLKGIVILRS